MFLLQSKGIVNDVIDKKYGIRGEEKRQGVPLCSLPYEWENAPEETKSFALVFQDYDNIPDEGVCWIHWLIADIPPETHELNENASREDTSLIQGTNSWIMPYGPYAEIENDLALHYGGPAPGRTHEYETKIYALDKVPGMTPGFFYNELLRKMEGHILAESTLKGYYIV